MTEPPSPLRMLLSRHTKRRAFISLLGGAAAWPLAARAQQQTMPVIGFLGAPSAAPYARYIAAVHQGLNEVGYIERQNVAMEYRWADSQYDRLPVLAADLVSRRVAVIVPIGGAPAVLAAKAATSSIPIVFNVGADPIQLGLVSNFNRPGGNITGVAMMTVEMETKRLELLHELAPASAPIAILLNPSNAQAQSQEREIQRAAGVIGRQVLVLNAGTEQEIEKAFAALVRERAGALLVGGDTFFTSQAVLFVVLTARHAIPTIYPLSGRCRGADRTSNDADVSSTLPIIPYGGFSPIRLEGWRIGRHLPTHCPA